jgi:hypothetical protein
MLFEFTSNETPIGHGAGLTPFDLPCYTPESAMALIR